MHQPIKIKNQEDSASEILELISPYLKRWYLYVILGIVGLLGVTIYISYTIPLVSNTATLLIHENKKSYEGSDIRVLEELDLIKSSSNIQNDIELFKAYSVIEPVVDSLKLYQQLFLLENNSDFKKEELFENLPFQINTSLKDSSAKFTEFTFILEILSDKVFNFSSDKENFENIPFNKDFSINSSNLKLNLIINKSFIQNFIGKRIEVTLLPKLKAVRDLTELIKIEKQSNESSIIKISLQGYNIEKINRTIDELIKSYQRDVHLDRNMIKARTSDFIKERIKFLVEELTEVEKYGEDYKKGKGILDLQVGLNDYYTSKGETQENLNEVAIQLSLASMLLDYMNEIVSFDDLLPANIGFQDVNINQMSEQYNKLILDRKKLLQGSKYNNPLVIKNEEQLNSLKNSIINGLKNLKKIYEVKVDAYNEQFNSFNGQFSKLPKFEREYRAILRQQQIKESLYLYLLQKREENEIEMAATVSNFKVVQPPLGEGVVISPKKTLLYIAAITFAIVISSLIVFLSELLDRKVNSEKDMKSLNVIGQIPKSDVSNSIMNFNERSFLSESFRMLRTNVNFMVDSQVKCPVIAVSSTLPSEGKTFISINLAQTFASVGKKVILVGLDLRVPKLKDYFEITDETGVSNFISDSSITLDAIIHNYNENLSFINSGDIPPNPAELLLKPRFELLLKQLKENYDLIVLDTSPIGIISDCIPAIKNQSDLLIYIARLGYLDKKMVDIPVSYLKDGLVKNLHVVLNYAKPLEKRYGGSYRYGYTYTDNYFGKTDKKWSFRKALKYFFNKD